MLSCSQLFDMCTGRAWDQLVTTSWARPHKSCGIPDSPGDPYGKPMKLRHASGHPICTLGYQKIVLWRPRPPKRSQNGTQNGAKSSTADPHETCAGVCRSHIRPPLGRSFFSSSSGSEENLQTVAKKCPWDELESPHGPKDLQNDPQNDSTF